MIILKKGFMIENLMILDIFKAHSAQYQYYVRRCLVHEGAVDEIEVVVVKL